MNIFGFKCDSWIFFRCLLACSSAEHRCICIPCKLCSVGTLCAIVCSKLCSTGRWKGGYFPLCLFTKQILLTWDAFSVPRIQKYVNESLCSLFFLFALQFCTSDIDTLLKVWIIAYLLLVKGIRSFHEESSKYMPVGYFESKGLYYNSSYSWKQENCIPSGKVPGSSSLVKNNGKNL